MYHNFINKMKEMFKLAIFHKYIEESSCVVVFRAVEKFESIAKITRKFSSCDKNVFKNTFRDI